jgi:hypothetical protein
LSVVEPESKVRAIERSGAHLYFAPSPELLTPFMKRYAGRRTILRPSNLEDVFLELVGDTPEDRDADVR